MLGNKAIDIKVTRYNIQYIWYSYLHILLVSKNVCVCPVIKKSVVIVIKSLLLFYVFIQVKRGWNIYLIDWYLYMRWCII